MQNYANTHIIGCLSQTYITFSAACLSRLANSCLRKLISCCSSSKSACSSGVNDSYISRRLRDHADDGTVLDSAASRSSLVSCSLDDALRMLTEARELEDSGAFAVTDEHRIETRMLTGIAHLRVAETRHCIDHRTADSCVFPIEGGGVHGDPEPARRAAAGRGGR